MSKYNVGDKVRIVSKRGSCWNIQGRMDHWCNKVMTILEVDGGLYRMVEDQHENGGSGWLWGNDDIVGLVKEKKDEKIVITHDGKTTTATLYKADGSKEKATARCAPEDTFDFNFGAKLAMERLMEKVEPVVEWRVVNRKPQVGDYIRLKDCVYSFDHIGDILKVDLVKENNLVTIYEKNHPNLKEIKYPDFEWNYYTREYEVVEKVTATKTTEPEPPKRYNGKVCCVENTTSNKELYTVGKIYQFHDGVLTADDGWEATPWNRAYFESFEEWKQFSNSEWIEIVE